MKKIEVVSDGSNYLFESEENLSFRVGTYNGGMMLQSDMAGVLYITEAIPKSTQWKTIAMFKTWEMVQSIG